MIKTIFLIHHSHTDIGYTDFQAKVIEDHADFIDQVLELCDRTDQWPDEARFHWTCETAWMVKNYFQKRPARIEEFIKRVKEGRIEVTALYLNFTDLFTLEMVIRSLYYSKEIEAKYGIKIQAAMNGDVNGLSWNLPQLLHKCDVKYLLMASDEIRSFAPAVPRPFYWESPDGSRVLTWNASRQSWYAEGIRLGFIYGIQNVKDMLPGYLAAIGKDYRREEIALQIAMDNVPPYLKVSEIVREWNEQGLQPRLVLATPTQFFQFMEKKYNDLPTFRLAWPDWWADGNGSCAWESALSLKTSRLMLENEARLALSNLHAQHYPQEAIDRIWDNLTFFAEHTFGAADSIQQPWSLQTKAQWNAKSAFLYQAATEAEKLHAKLVETPVKKDLPSTQTGKSMALENAFYSIVVDERTGAIKHIRDKESGEELVDQQSEFLFDQYYYETISSPEGRKAIWKDKDPSDMWSPDRKGYKARARHFSAKLISAESEENECHKTIKLQLKANGCRAISHTIKLHQNVKLIEFTHTVDKEEVLATESLYYMFPFNFGMPEIRICGPGKAVFKPDTDQLPDTCRGWYSLEDWVLLSDSTKSVLWVSPDAPLIQLGRINTAKWARKLRIKHALLVSYVMNNHWFTNFRASQSGAFTFTCAMTSVPGRMDLGDAHSFAQKFTNPVLDSLLLESFHVNRGNIQLLSFKRSANGKGYILRLKETEGTRTAFDLHSPRFPSAAFFRAMPVERVMAPAGKGRVTAEAAPHEILTYFVETAP